MFSFSLIQEFYTCVYKIKEYLYYLFINEVHEDMIVSLYHDFVESLDDTLRELKRQRNILIMVQQKYDINPEQEIFLQILNKAIEYFKIINFITFESDEYKSNNRDRIIKNVEEVRKSYKTEVALLSNELNEIINITGKCNFCLSNRMYTMIKSFIFSQLFWNSEYRKAKFHFYYDCEKISINVAEKISLGG